MTYAFAQRPAPARKHAGTTKRGYNLGAPHASAERHADAIADSRTRFGPAVPTSASESTSEVSSSIATEIDRERGTGAALPPTLRSTMEQQLHASLDDVRIHTGASARSSSLQLDADAFSVGHDVFWAGPPSSLAGERELLAHELAHVLQNRATGDDSLIRRGKKKKSKVSAKTMSKMVTNPTLAHRKWDKLSESQQQSMLEQMAGKFGEDWASEFDALHRVPDMLRLDDFYNPSTPPSVQNLQADGWGFVYRHQEFEQWVHPDGRIAQFVRSEPLPKSMQPTAAAAPSAAPQSDWKPGMGVRQPFGREINTAITNPDDSATPFAFYTTGQAILYQAPDGLMTIEWFPDGSDKPIIYQGKRGGTFSSQSETTGAITAWPFPAEDFDAMFSPQDMIPVEP